MLVVFIFTMLLMTVFAVIKINRLHEIKARDGYKFDANDTKFEKISDIVSLAFFCMVAAVLCGCTPESADTSAPSPVAVSLNGVDF